MHELNDVVAALDVALHAQDLDAVMQFYADDAVLVMEPGRVAEGALEIRAFFETLFQMGLSARQLATHVLQSGDTALFTSRWIAEGIQADGESFSRKSVATSVFRRTPEGQWLMVIDNSFGPAVLDTTA